MIDQIFDRSYQQARPALNRAMENAGRGIWRSIGETLRALHRLKWSAPWAAPEQARSR